MISNLRVESQQAISISFIFLPWENKKRTRAHFMSFHLISYVKSKWKSLEAIILFSSIDPNDGL